MFVFVTNSTHSTITILAEGEKTIRNQIKTTMSTWLQWRERNLCMRLFKCLQRDL